MLFVFCVWDAHVVVCTPTRHHTTNCNVSLVIWQIFTTGRINYVISWTMWYGTALVDPEQFWHISYQLFLQRFPSCSCRQYGFDCGKTVVAVDRRWTFFSGGHALSPSVRKSDALHTHPPPSTSKPLLSALLHEGYCIHCRFVQYIYKF